ncbi:MAG: helix-turn-helix domain-containing protein [Oscillospiraceae bacterium]|nr:helix-turn-helix domain-containing protein [Oscillospiraceae bacterium]
MRQSRNNGMITIREIAEYLRISLPSAYNLIERKAFPYLKVGCRYVVPRDTFLLWVDQNTVKGAAYE